jgi:hypothetical protein
MRATVIAFKNLKYKAKDMEAMAMTQAGVIYKTQVMINASVKGPSLDRLQRMGYPYSKRRHPGGIDTSTLGGKYIRQRYLVHKRSGKFARSIKGKLELHKGRQSYLVYANKGTAKHIKFVIEGTRIMHGRNIIWMTGKEKMVQRRMKKAIVKTFGAQLRAQAMIRIG